MYLYTGRYPRRKGGRCVGGGGLQDSTRTYRQGNLAAELRPAAPSVHPGARNNNTHTREQHRWACNRQSVAPSEGAKQWPIWCVCVGGHLGRIKPPRCNHQRQTPRAVPPPPHVSSKVRGGQCCWACSMGSAQPSASGLPSHRRQFHIDPMDDDMPTRSSRAAQVPTCSTPPRVCAPPCHAMPAHSHAHAQAKPGPQHTCWPLSPPRPPRTTSSALMPMPSPPSYGRSPRRPRQARPGLGARAPPRPLPSLPASVPEGGWCPVSTTRQRIISHCFPATTAGRPCLRGQAQAQGQGVASPSRCCLRGPTPSRLQPAAAARRAQGSSGSRRAGSREACVGELPPGGMLGGGE